MYSCLCKWDDEVSELLRNCNFKKIQPDKIVHWYDVHLLWMFIMNQVDSENCCWLFTFYVWPIFLTFLDRIRESIRCLIFPHKEKFFRYNYILIFFRKLLFLQSRFDCLLIRTQRRVKLSDYKGCVICWMMFRLIVLVRIFKINQVVTLWVISWHCATVRGCESSFYQHQKKKFIVISFEQHS